MQLRATSALIRLSTPPAPEEETGHRNITKRTASSFGDRSRTDSYASRVVEMAEMAADQHRDALRVQQASASQRLRDRLLVRQGLLTQPSQASNSTKATTQARPRRSPHHVAPGPGRGAPGL